MGGPPPSLTLYLPTGFVVWGGNSGGLKLGDKVNFWGSQWAKQVTGGNYDSQADFKGYADTIKQFGICLPTPLNNSCWETKPGNSMPPAVLPQFIGVIVSTAIAKNQGDIFGNIAALVIVKVDPVPAYGNDPGKPGFGTIVAVIEDGANILPKPVMLTATQTQPATVQPGQTINVNVDVTNTSSNTATNVTVNEIFDGLTPATGSAVLGNIEAGQKRSQTFTTKVPTIEPRTDRESNAAYQTRLAAANGRIYTSTGTITFNESALPIEVTSASTLQLPQISVAIGGPVCVGPGQKVSYAITVTNIGSAAAATASIKFNFPDGTSTTIPVTNLPAGMSFSTTTPWTVPLIAPRGANETVADYLARLSTFDGKSLTATAIAAWSDAVGNSYGAIDQSFTSIERVPIIDFTSQLPALALPNQQITLNFNVKNKGTGNAAQVNLNVTNPDATKSTVAPFELEAGKSTNVQTNFTVPQIAAKQSGESDSAYQARLLTFVNKKLSFNINADWAGVSQDKYGPTSGVAETLEALPVLDIKLEGPATAGSGDTVTYIVTLKNLGNADAANIDVTFNGETRKAVTLGSPIQFNYTIPKTQPNGPITLTASVVWQDGVLNNYGPLSASVTTNVTRRNLAPVVNAGLDQTIILPAAAQLNGTVTDDGQPPNVPITIMWSKVSGPGTVTFANANMAATTATFSAAGTYVLKLSASDTELTGSDEVMIVVNAPTNLAPVVNAGPDQTITLPDSATLTGSVTDDGRPAGAMLTITWSMVSGPCPVNFTTTNQTSTVASFGSPGTYVLRLTANDSQLSASDDLTITVKAATGAKANRPPFVNAGADLTFLPGFRTLMGTVIDDGIPQPLTISWSLLSGPDKITFDNPTALTTNVLFNLAGNYVVRLSASDGQFTTTDEINITIVPFNNAPFISVSFTQIITTRVTQLQGYAIDDEFPLGRVLTYKWRIEPGFPQAGTVTFSNERSAATTATFSNTGTYSLLFEVSDGELLSTLRFAIFVKENGVNLAPIVNAGSDQSVQLPNKAMLLATVADDGLPPPGSLTKTWSLVSGPAPVTILYTNEERTAATAQFTQAGTYVFKFTANDGALESSDEMTVTALSGVGIDLAARDLMLANVTIDGQTLAFSASAQVSVVNSTTTATATNFTIKFFEDRDGNGKFDATDNLLGSATQNGIAANSTLNVTAQLQGTLLFHSNLIFAYVDANNDVVEEVEDNNYASTKPPCTFQPTSTAFVPRLKYQWSGSTRFPTEAEVVITPVVVDINGDGIADIIFTSMDNTATRTDVFPVAHINAINGRDGSEIFTSRNFVYGVGGLAVGDIDRDGRPEIIAIAGFDTRVGIKYNNLVCFNHDGSLKWISPSTQFDVIDLGAPSIADIDQDGLPEIILGNNVFNNDGTLRWQGAGGFGGSLGNIPLSYAFDLDLDGKPEVVAGNTAYRADGTIYWRNSTIPDGLTAVGNFDADDNPEIVLVVSTQIGFVANNQPGAIYLLEHDGTIKWGPLTIPFNEGGGPPMVADLDGDGKAEIGVATKTNYTVYDHNGNIKWRKTTKDANSGITSSTAFDFNGDGQLEVVYADDNSLYIFKGSDGTELFKTGKPSWTGIENPVIADIDGDGKANIIAVANILFGGGFGFTGPKGIYVYEDTANQWLAARPVWNQHAYHITNVNNDGTIPAKEENSLTVFNGFRAQAADGCAYAQPDLIPSFVRQTAAGAQIKLTVRIGNGGGIAVGRDVPVAFYNGDPSDGGTLLGTVRTSQYLAPGQFEDVSIMVAAETIALPLFVVADDTGTGKGIVTEVDENNNRHNSRIFLSPLANKAPVVNVGPDQSITLPNNSITINGTVTDDGFPTQNITVFWGVVSGPGNVTFSAVTSANTMATFSRPGVYVLRLTADDGQLTGRDELVVTVNTNNQPPVVNAGADTAINVNSTSTLQGTITDDGLPQGSTLKITWSLVTGPGNNITIISTPDQASTDIKVNLAGNYVFRLTVDDGEFVVSDEVAVTANEAAPNQAPVVNAGPDRTITLPIDTVEIQANVTDDGLPNNRLQIAWSVLSGPREVTFGNVQQSGKVTATFLEAGTYILRLTANDGALSASDDVQITVKSDNANKSPVVNAGANQSITLPTNSVTLNGTVTDDGLPTGKPFTIKWSAISGPGTVSFSNQNGAVITATFSVAGMYTLRLTASDSELASSDDVVVTVISTVGAPPIVKITSPADGTELTKPTDVLGIVRSGGAVTWKLEYALAPDEEDPASATWVTFAMSSGNVENAKLGVFDPTLLLNGIYGIRLIATDEAGQVSGDQISVVVTRNMKIGNFTVSFTDLAIPVSGIPIQIIRTYDSRDKRKGDFGVGWTLDIKSVRVEKNITPGKHWAESLTFSGPIFNYCLDETRPHIVTVTFPDGKVFKFKAVTSPSCNIAAIVYPTMNFVPMPGTIGKLEALDNADLRVLGEIPQTTGAGVVQIVNLVGSNPGSPYNPRLFKFTSGDGIEFVVDEKLGLQSVKDLDGNTLTITANGIIHSSGKSVVFMRDAQGRITQITDPRGNPQFYTYDANGDLISFKDAENNTTTFSYNGAHGLLTINDPRGITPVRNEYDAGGRLIKHIDSFGKEIVYTHNIGSRQEVIKDRLGNATTFDYDDNGNVLQQTDPEGAVTRFTYDQNDNQLTVTNALGKTTTSTYDQFDNKLTETDPLGNTTKFTYNNLRRLITITDPRGAVTNNTYDNKGRVTSTRDPLGALTSFTYNLAGNVLTQTDALGRITRNEYDNFGNLMKVTDAQGNVSTFAYDASGNRTIESIPRFVGFGVTGITTVFTYDKLGRVITIQNPFTFRGFTFRHIEYNAIGKQSKTIDELGRATSFTYDNQGQLIRTTYADQMFEESTYDAEGRRLTSKDRAGRITSFIYDKAGRLTQTTFPDNTTTSSTYDLLGRVVTTKDALGHITTYEYDPNCGCSGRRTSVIDAIGNVTRFAFDSVGNQVSVTDANNRTTHFDYDLNNRQTRVRFADNSQQVTEYDVLGRRTASIDQAGQRTSFEYDELGRLVKVIDALGQTTSYSYDPAGSQLTQTDAMGRTTQYLNDEFGRRAVRILPGGEREVYGYDPVGNLSSYTNFNGTQTINEYDAVNRLVLQRGGKNFSYTYTASGQRASVTDNAITDNTGTILYTYDERGRLIKKQTPNGTLTYSYDAVGNLTSLRSSNEQGVAIDYGYDQLNRLQTVTDLRQGTTTNLTNYEYDKVGNLAKVALGNGVETSYQYNSLNRLTEVNANKGATAIKSYSYTLAAAGNRLKVSELGGRTVGYSYDALYRLTSETISGASNVTNNGKVDYQYDKVGNRLERTSTVQAVPVQQLNVDQNDRLTTDIHDSNGNPIRSGGKEYGFDVENRIRGVFDPATNTLIRMNYDFEGNRISKTVGMADRVTRNFITQTTTKYLVDTNSLTGFSQIVEEIQDSKVVKQYSYGLDLISQRQLINGQRITHFYGYDGHGSVRYLTDKDGKVTDEFDYDAYGLLINRTGTTPNNYQFAGEQFDEDLGMYFLRARYLNVTTGRFFTQDSFEGNRFDPISLHKYLYANSDPVNKKDPSGLRTVVETQIGIGVLEVLTAIVIYQFSKAVDKFLDDLSRGVYTRTREFKGYVYRALRDDEGIAFGGIFAKAPYETRTVDDHVILGESEGYVDQYISTTKLPSVAKRIALKYNRKRIATIDLGKVFAKIIDCEFSLDLFKNAAARAQALNDKEVLVVVGPILPRAIVAEDPVDLF